MVENKKDLKVVHRLMGYPIGRELINSNLKIIQLYTFDRFKFLHLSVPMES